MKCVTILFICYLLFGFSQGYSQIPNYVPQNGLVGWWPFNGNANDESGNGNHGVMIDGASNVPDRFDTPNYALGLDGMNDYVRLLYPFVDCVDFSISAWVLHTNKGNYSGILSDADQALENDLYFNINDSEIGITADKSGRNLRSCNLPSIRNYVSFYNKGSFDSVWVHVVVTTTQNQTKIYINGELKGESNVGGSNVGYHNPNPVFGKITDQGYSIQYFRGKLDDIGIWDRVLDSNEMKRLFNNESSLCSYVIKESDTTICPGTSLKLNAIQTSKTKSLIPQDGLVGYWPFNGNANDESGNGNHGKIIGELELTSDRLDISSSSYNFTGNGHIQLPNINLPSFTLNAWVKRNTNTTDNGVVISKHYSSSRTNSSYLMYSAPEANNYCTPKIYFTNTSTNPSSVQAKDSSWCDSNWHMITGTLDSSWLKIYFDGVLVDSISGGVALSTDFPTLIGSSYSFLGEITNQNFGKIDDVAFYNRSLTRNEVFRLFETQSSNCRDTLSNDKFNWSDGQNGRTITVNPDTSTTYVLTVTDGLIIHQDSIRVTVGGDSCYSCTYAILEQDTVICEGTTLQLHAELSDTTKAYIPKEGLIGYWPFNGNANDESGNGNHGKVNGASLTKGRNGKDNQAYAFDGVDDFIQTNNDSISSDGYAISAWFKTTNNAEGQGLVISRSQSQVDGIYLNKDRIVQCMSNCNKSFHLNEKTIQYNDDKWHHFVSVYDGKQMRGYIDGQLYSMQDQVGTICLNAPFEFGNDRPYARFYKGILDDIAIWNRPLSDSEVVSLFKLESVKVNTTIPQDGLIGYWPFNGNAQDQSSLANHGEVNGATLTTDRCDKRNSAYEFNGIDNFIEVKDSESLSNMNSITMSAWIFLDNDSKPFQGILTKWWQGVNCTDNSDNYCMAINNVPQTNNEAKFVCGTNNYTNYQLQSTVKVNTNNWMHLSFVHDKTVGGKLYINGVFAGSTDIPGEICKSTNPLLIGADNNRGTYWRFFDGKIDDLAIWNRALSDSEIVDVYNAGSCNCLDTLSEDKFKWSTGEKGRKITVSPNTSTMYTLEVNRGQIIDRDTIHVTVLESPKPDIFGHVKVYERQVNYSYYTQLNDSSTYEWTITGNGKLSSTNGGSSILVDFKEPGYAYLTVTETNKYGCKKDTTITIRIYGITDIDESEKNSQMLTIYPNPINEFNSLTVQAFLPPSSRSYLTITNMLGKTLETIELGNNDSYSEIKLPLSTEGLSNGVYMIQLHINGEYISRTLIINR
jgi:Concanavalin A-like lectin/glucanases superfamily/Secretion system C-terminal sorting domain